MSPTNTKKDRQLLLLTLKHSQKEAVASSTMTATCDNFMNAFALHLGATSLQMGFLTAFPQLLGSIMQMVSVWLGTVLNRKLLVLVAAATQCVLMFAIMLLAWQSDGSLVKTFIILVVLYHGASHTIQPQWRAWMGSIVPQKSRGVFFAGRTRLTMATTLIIFLGGGLFLSLSDRLNLVGAGFAFMFLAAAIGRSISCYHLWRMHDPVPLPVVAETNQLISTLRLFVHAMHDRTFRNYSIFIACMQGMVAISAPFFAVYMLNELHFTYFQYALNLMASIAVQFLMLRFWGKISDSHGNRLVMLLCGFMIPLLPLLWLLSANFYFLLLVQMISGLFWSGFTLTTANYLYDIRPHQTNFATYAAVQALLTAVMVFIGALAGGLLASIAPTLASWLPFQLGSALFIVFAVSGVMRALVLAWFLPRAEEPTVRSHPELLQVIFRVSRFNAISGVVLDWLTLTEKKKP